MPEVHVRGHVVGKGRPRFVRNGNRVGVFTPDATVEAERAIAAAWVGLGARPILRPNAVELQVEARLARPKMHFRTARGHEQEVKPNAPARPTVKPDLDNLVKTVKDALNGVAWEDDAQVVYIDAHKFYAKPEGWYIRVEALPAQVEMEL